MRCDESSIGFRWRSKMSAYPELPLTDRHQSKSLRDLFKVPFLKNFISSGLAHPIEPLSCLRIPPGNGMGFYQPNSKKLRSWAETFSPYARLPS